MVKGSFKYSLCRVLQTKTYWGLIAIMSLVTIVDAVLNYFPYSENGSRVFWYDTFMGSGGMSSQLLAAFLLNLMPVWLLLGSGNALLSDFKTGQVYNAVSRLGLKKYLKHQYLAAGLASSLMFAIPLLANLLAVYVIHFFVKDKAQLDKLAGLRLILKPVPENKFLFWRLENPVQTYFIYFFLIVFLAFVIGLLIISLSMVFNKMYQVLTVLVLSSILLGTQLFQFGYMTQTFDIQITLQNWLLMWVTLLGSLLILTGIIYLWRGRGELE